MANKHGRLGAVYWGANTAVPVAETHGDFDLNLDTDMEEDTSHGDTWKTRIPGLKDWKLAFSKWFDTAYHVLMDAAIASTVGKYYHYPDRTDATVYWYGTGYVAVKSFKTPLGGIIDESYEIIPVSQPTYVHP